MQPEELGRLLDRHAAALQLFARQWCAHPDDVVQEAFVRLVQQSGAPNDPVAWLYRVVRNGAISAARSAGRRHRHESQAVRDHWFAPRDDDLLDARLAAESLELLPLEQREPIVAHLWGDLTFEQIADIAGVSITTAYRRYQAGLKTLRERLEAECPPKNSFKT
ncbi:MAG TPA: RNA polymerase sigma factor [Planctomycetaceae bacterium]|nr:RNA polymerase sigma factor [Planctomycetaceae bacterium]